MTAPAAAAAAETVAPAAARAAPAAAPTASAPVGTARASASSPGTAARTKRQLAGPRPRSSSTSKSTGTSSRSKNSRSGGGGQDGGGKRDRGGPKKGPFLLPKKTGYVNSRARRLLLGEFVLCAVIIALSPLTDKHKTDGPVVMMKRNTAIAALFLLLALVSSAGRGSARVAAGFGGLVTVALLVSDRDVFVKVAERFGAPASSGPAGPDGPGGTPPAGEAPVEGPEEPVTPPKAPPDFVPGTPNDPWWAPLLPWLGLGR